MYSHLAGLLALRTQALTLSVVTTGSATLAATTTGYTRSSGSFLTDGFATGMEITPTGFTSNPVDIVTNVTAGVLSVKTARTAESAAAGKTIAVGLPALRAWENLDFTPTAGRWFVEEDYLPGPAAQITLGRYGQIETLPQYVLKLYGMSNTGPGALYRAADALLTLFAPRTEFTCSTGDVVMVRTNPAPYRGQLIPAEAGWSAVVVTIPCLVRAANST